MPTDLLTFDAPTQYYTMKEVKQALSALPAYFGGKRKIIERVFDERLPHAGRLVDPMAGAMTIPLAGKILGHEVAANDRSHGSYIIGKALIENESVLIDGALLPSLIQPVDGMNNYITDQFGDFHLPKQLATYADAINAHITEMDESQQWVYKLLLYRFLTFMAPYNLFRYPGLTRGFLNGTYPKSMQGHIDKWNKNIADPLPTLEKMAKQINTAIFTGTGSIVQQDVFEFMDANDEGGDILYFDPPYAGAGVPYERGYEVIEQMMARQDIVRENSVFNDLDQERDALKRVLAHGVNYQFTVFSYWTELHDREWFEELLSEVGLASEEIPLGNYNYSYSTKVGKKGEWTSKKDKGTKEILFLLTPKT